MLLNRGVGEDSSGSPWTARRSYLSIVKEISPEYSLEELMLKLKLQSLATWCKEVTHRKRSWCWERLNTGGEGDDRGWDDWMASPTQWTWVWVSSGSWWWTEKPGVLQSTGLQRVRHNWAILLKLTNVRDSLSISSVRFEMWIYWNIQMLQGSGEERYSLLLVSQWLKTP